MTKFYESKAGQHLLDRTPVMMQTLMVAIQQKMIPQLEALQAEVKTVSAEPIPAPPVSPPEERRKAATSTSTKKKATTKKASSSKKSTTTKKASTTKKAPAKKTTTKKKTS
jgi:hypothetical protein